MRRARSDRERFAADACLALVLGVWGQIEVWVPSVGDPGSLPGPRWAVSVTWVVVAGCVAFRRPAAFAALAVASTASLLQAAVYGAPEGFGSLLPMLVLFYSVAAYEETALALTGLGVALASTVAHAYLDPLNHGNRSNLAADLAFSSVLIVMWGAGFVVRRRRLASAASAARVAQEEQDRASAMRAAVADERARIARELHDVVSHSLGIVVVQAEAADELLDNDPAGARTAVHSIRRTAREGLVEMRRMLGVLRSLERPSLEVQPSLSTLSALADEVSATGLPVRLSIEEPRHPVAAGVAISVYRIVQESLTNAIKHAQATQVEVRVRCGDCLELEIEDDGVGPGYETGTGHGLIGIRERVAALNGTVDFGRGPSGGFRVRATLPLGDAT